MCISGYYFYDLTVFIGNLNHIKSVTKFFIYEFVFESFFQLRKLLRYCKPVTFDIDTVSYSFNIECSFHHFNRRIAALFGFCISVLSAAT